MSENLGEAILELSTEDSGLVKGIANAGKERDKFLAESTKALSGAAQAVSREQARAAAIAQGAYIDGAGRLRASNGKFMSEAQAMAIATGASMGDAIGTGVDAGSRKARQSFATAASQMGSDARSAGQKASLYLTAPILLAGKKAFDAYGNFDQTIRQVGAVAEVSGSQLGQMSDMALKMGKETSFSANEAATAMLELAKGGISQAQIGAGVLDQTLTLAAAGSLELGEAAGYMTNTLNAFGLGASSAAGVAAALAGGANASTASVQSLGMGLAQVGRGAIEAGMSLNETVAALAVFENNGVKGSDAGTSLKTMLTRLVPSTDEAADAMKKLGLDFTDAKGNIMPMAQVAQHLQDRLKGLTQEQRIAALTTIFGSDASRAAGMMAAAGASGINQMATATKDFSAAQELAKTNTEGAKGSIEQMTGSVETAAIAAGQALAPTVIDLAADLQSAADKFSELDADTQKTIVTLAGVVAVVGPLLALFGSMATGVSAVVTVVGAGAAAATALGGAIGTLAMAAGTAVPALASFSLVIASNPLLVGAVAIGVIAAAALAVAKFGIDARKSGDDTAYARQQLEEYQSALDKTTGSLTSSRQADTALTSSKARLTAASKALKTAEDEYGRNSPQYRAAVGAKRDATDQYNDALNRSKKAHRDSAKDVADFAAKTKKAADAYKGSGDSIKGIVAQMDFWRDAAKNGGKESQVAAGQLKRLQKQLDEASKSGGNAKQSLSDLAAQFPELVRAAGGLTPELQAIKTAINNLPKEVRINIYFQQHGKMPAGYNQGGAPRSSAPGTPQAHSTGRDTLGSGFGGRSGRMHAMRSKPKADPIFGTWLGLDEIAQLPKNVERVNQAQAQVDAARDKVRAAAKTSSGKDDRAAKKLLAAAVKRLAARTLVQRQADELSRQMAAAEARNELDTNRMMLDQANGGTGSTSEGITARTEQLKKRYAELEALLRSKASKLSVSARASIVGTMTSLKDGIDAGAQELVEAAKAAKQAVLDGFSALTTGFNLNEARQQFDQQTRGIVGSAIEAREDLTRLQSEYAILLERWHLEGAKLSEEGQTQILNQLSGLASAIEQQRQAITDAARKVISDAVSAIQSSSDLKQAQLELELQIAGGDDAGRKAVPIIEAMIAAARSEYNSLTDQLRVNGAEMDEQMRTQITSQLTGILRNIDGWEERMQKAADQGDTDAGFVRDLQIIQQFSSEPDMFAASKSAAFAYRTAGLVAG